MNGTGQIFSAQDYGRSSLPMAQSPTFNSKLSTGSPLREKLGVSGKLPLLNLKHIAETDRKVNNRTAAEEMDLGSDLTNKFHLRIRSEAVAYNKASKLMKGSPVT